MFVIKRKYVIKAYTAMFALILLISAVFLNSYFNDIKKEKQETEKFMSFISSVGTIIQKTESLLEFVIIVL